MPNIWGQQDADVNGGAQVSAPLLAWGNGDAAAVVPTPSAAQGEPAQLLPAAPYDATDAVVHGLSLGLSDVGRAALMAGTRYLTGQTPSFDYGQASREVQRGREVYANQSPISSTAANIAGAVVGPAGAAVDAMRAAGPIAKAAIGAISGGGAGAVQGAADNSATPSEALQGAEKGGEIGAAIGGGLPLAGAVGRALLPEITPAAQTLRAAGIEPTPGSAIGGLPGAAENLMSRVPILGSPVNAGRQAALDQFNSVVAKNADDFNRNTINGVLAHVGESLNPATATGNDAISEMADKVGNAYKAAVPSSGGALDQQALQDITNAKANAQLLLPADRAQQFSNFVDNNIIGRVQQAPTQAGNWQQAAQQLGAGQMAPHGTLPGQAFKDAESDLGKEASTYLSGNSTSDERKLGQAYQNLQGTLRSWLARVNPQNAEDIQNANQAYAKMLRVQEAASRSPTGGFSPENLLAASKKYGGAAQYARGNALMQPEAQNALLDKQLFNTAGQSVLRAPQGSGGHAAGVGAGIVGAEVLEHLMQNPSPTALGTMALAYPALRGLYSTPGRSAVNGLLSANIPSVTPWAPIAAQTASP